MRQLVGYLLGFNAVQTNLFFNRRSSVFDLAKAFTVGGIFTIAVFSIYFEQQSEVEASHKAYARSELEHVSSAISYSLAADIETTAALKAFVISNPEFTQRDFELFATALEIGHPNTISLQLAPNGVVKYVTQEERNKAALGHNLLAGSEKRLSAIRAKDLAELIVVGPVDLLQGGRAVIARRPIFLGEPQGFTSYFWGFATVLIDFHSVIEATGIDIAGLNVAVRGIAENGEQSPAFLGSDRLFDNPSATSRLRIGNAEWEFAINPLNKPLERIPSFVLSPWYWLCSALIFVFIVRSSLKVLHEPRRLEKAVADETRKLRDALDALAEKDRKNQVIFGVLAHELRTPVAAIEMLSQHGSDEWLKDKEVVNSAARDLLHSIDDMKMLINPDLKREKRIEATTVDQLNASISAMVASTLASTGVLYEQMTLVPDDIATQQLLTDSYRVKASITNLIRNACLHSEGSRVWCITSLSLNKTGNRFIHWTVCDNGKGISNEIVSALFKPYSRGDSKAEGTGLGLYVAKTWIEEIGGSVSYRQRETGSEFSVLVPLDSDHRELVAGAGVAVQGLGDVSDVASQLRVLLVEDDKVLQMVTARMLSKLFSHVEVASDGAEGLNRAEAGFDLILTDYFMPNMTGVQMISKLRERGYTQPILGATAATIAGQDQEMIAAGANQVLLKPINSEVILESVQTLLTEGFYKDIARGARKA